MKSRMKGTTFSIWIVIGLLTISVDLVENAPKSLQMIKSIAFMISILGISESYGNLIKRIEYLENKEENKNDEKN